jgi:hypothetical protein
LCYDREVARPTKAAIDLSDALDGATASQVQGLLEGGYGPAEPTDSTGVVDHFRALLPFMGRGRDGDVAVVKMAMAGRACQRLREVLAGFQTLAPVAEDTDDPDELVDDWMASPMPPPFADKLRQAVERMGPLQGFADEPGLAEVRLGAALLPFGQVTVGESIVPQDLVELATLGDAVRSDLGVPVEWESDDPKLLALDQAFLEAAIGVVRGSETWLREAEPLELVKGVRAAVVLTEAHETVGLISFSGEEERVRYIGHTAPVAVATLAQSARIFEISSELPGLIAELPPSLQAHFKVIETGAERVLRADEKRPDCLSDPEGSS